MPAAGTFTIANIGDAPLTIEVKSSCGCTVPSKPKSPLLPGESDELNISYDTVKRKGRARQRVTLITNDPSQPRSVITVTGNVKPLFRATPGDGIFFHRLTRDAEVTNTITLENEHSEPLELRLADGQDFGPFRIDLKELEPGQRYELAATTIVPMPEKSSRVEVLLDTGLPDLNALKIPVQAYVRPDVDCTPPLLKVHRAFMAPTQQEVRLVSRVDRDVRVTEVRPSTDVIQYEILPPRESRSGRAWREQVIRVTLPPGRDMPPDGAQLEVLTNATTPRHQRFVVDIEVFERSSRSRTADRNGKDD
jgi:hypothetical protein